MRHVGRCFVGVVMVVFPAVAADDEGGGQSEGAAAGGGGPGARTDLQHATKVSEVDERVVALESPLEIH